MRELAGRNWLFWLVWLCLGFGFWELLTDTYSVPEFGVGIGAAAAGASLAVLVRESTKAEYALPWPMLRRLAPLPLSAVSASAVVLWRLGLETARGRRVEGRTRALPFDHGGEGAMPATRRALQDLAVCVAPVTFSMGIDHELDLILVHELARPGEPEGDLAVRL